jgi:hypothetical protein
VDVRPVDPRDTRWEVSTPTYRVYFWNADLVSDEYELVGARDVHEVLAWAEANAGPGRTYWLSVRVDDRNGEPGLLRLAGHDPTEQPQRKV